MMRISAAAADPPMQAFGSVRLRRSARSRTREHGFTLIELLVVLTIIGLMSAAVVLAMPGEAAELRRDADSFAARANAAQEQAVLASRAVAVRIDSGGYAFERRAGAEWQAVSAHRWREGTIVRPESIRITFDPTGMSDPAQLLLERGGEQLAIDIGGDGSIHVRRPA